MQPTLKNLQVQQTELEKTISSLRPEVDEAMSAYQLLSETLRDKEKELQQVKQRFKDFTTEPRVSEHAIVRYFERELGYLISQKLRNKS